MPKVKITLTAEISDLSCFWPDDPKGSTRQNIYSHLRDALLSNQLMKLLDQMTLNGDSSPEINEAIIKNYKHDIELGKRFFDENGFSIEIV